MNVDLGVFGEVELDGDVTLLLDGGTHGCIGHTLAVRPDGFVRWERRLDSMGDQSECSGAGERVLAPAEQAEWELLVASLWTATVPEPHAAGIPQVPRYMWALAMRRGDEVHVLTGPPFADAFAPQPPEVREAFAWMAEHVKAWCA